MNENEPTSDEDPLDRIVDDLSAEEKAGQLVMALPQFLSERERRRIFGEYSVGSAIVRTPNNPAYMTLFTNQLQEYASESGTEIPLLVAGDFSYGTTASMPLVTGDAPPTARDGSQGGTAFPRAMALGASANFENARTAARITARELRAMGVHWNFAPVADVNTNPDNPVIGVRSFGENPRQVSEFVASAIEGYREGKTDERVLATAKHFPGHGDTAVDSHTGLPVVEADRATLEGTHFPPFERAIDAGVDAMMTAHVVTEALDPTHPATLSRDVLTDLLREELGYDGLIVTDSMDMAGVKEGWGREKAAVRAVAAGADVVCAVSKGEEAFDAQVRTVEALADAIQLGTLPAKRVDAAVGRVLAAKRRVGLLDDEGTVSVPTLDPLDAMTTVGTPIHRRVAARIGRESVTVVRNDGVLPFDPDREATTLVAGVTDGVTRVGRAVQSVASGDVVTWQASHDPSDREIERASALATNADRTLCLTHSGRGQPDLSDRQVRLVEALREAEAPLVAVAQELPYDLAHYDSEGAIAAYCGVHEGELVHLGAVVRVLFGASPTASLPVTVGEFPAGHGLDFDEN